MNEFWISDRQVMEIVLLFPVAFCHVDVTSIFIFNLAGNFDNIQRHLFFNIQLQNGF